MFIEVILTKIFPQAWLDGNWIPKGAKSSMSHPHTCECESKSQYCTSILRVGLITERTQSEANKARIVAAIDARGQDFLLTSCRKVIILTH